MSEKRTEQIAVRITPETKEFLVKEAKKLDWTTAKLAEKILSSWVQEAKANKGGAVTFIQNEIHTINFN